MKTKGSIYKYFRLNDEVINEEIWGKQLFIIHGFGGNAYLPELYVHRRGETVTAANSCNWNVRNTQLINSPKRPFKKLKKIQLSKLLISGKEKVKEEVKREIVIRANQKSYGFI